MKTFAKNNLEKLKLKNVQILQHIHKLKESAEFFFLIAFLIVAATLMFHTFPQAKHYKEIKENIETKKFEIAEAQEQKKNLKEEQQSKKDTYETLRKEAEPKLAIVFPEGENISELTRFLEGYSIAYHSTENPFELNNIAYGKSKLSESGNYNILPIRMSINASEKNFGNFLKMIAYSGSMDPKDFFRNEPIRLMSVESINVSVPKVAEGETAKKADAKVPTYAFSVEVNTFFRASKADADAAAKDTKKKAAKTEAKK